jgi:hypothetical protein
MKINEFAKDLDIKGQDDSTIDPITLLAILSLLIQIGKLLYECWEKNHSNLLETCRKPNIIQTAVLREKILKAFPGAENRKFRSLLREQILLHAKDLTEEQIKSIILESINEEKQSTQATPKENS